MLILIVGLLVFLVPHSVAIVAPAWRSQKKAAMGEKGYAIAHSVLSLIGLVLIVWGFGQTRVDPIFIWHPPPAMYHLTSLLVLVSFVLFAAKDVPNNQIKAAVGHPMVLAVKVWAFAHLLANGRLGDIVLFGSFLVWAIVLFISLRKSDRLASNESSTGTLKGTLIAIVGGFVIWLVFALWVHRWLIGVAPFG